MTITKTKWFLPVAIILGVGLFGGGGYYMKKKNHANTVVPKVSENSVNQSHSQDNDLDQSAYAIQYMNNKNITDQIIKKNIMSELNKIFITPEYGSKSNDEKRELIHEFIDSKKLKGGKRRSKRRSNKSRVYKKGSQKK